MQHRLEEHLQSLNLGMCSLYGICCTGLCFHQGMMLLFVCQSILASTYLKLLQDTKIINSNNRIPTEMAILETIMPHKVQITPNNNQHQTQMASLVQLIKIIQTIKMLGEWHLINQSNTSFKK